MIPTDRACVAFRIAGGEFYGLELEPSGEGPIVEGSADTILLHAGYGSAIATPSVGFTAEGFGVAWQDLPDGLDALLFDWWGDWSQKTVSLPCVVEVWHFGELVCSHTLATCAEVCREMLVTYHAGPVRWLTWRG